MRVRFAAIALVAASVTGVQAQLASIIGGLSTNCSNAALGVLQSPFGQCAALTDLVGFLLAGNDTVVDTLTSYLNVACTRNCTESDVQNAAGLIEAGCATELEDGNAIATSVRFVIANYITVANGLCLESTSNNTYCITQTIETVDGAIGSNLSPTDVIALLSNASSLADIDASALCTDCTKALVSTFQDVDQLTQIAEDKCGASYGDGQVPTSVSRRTASNDTSPSSSASGASSTSNAPSASGTAAPSASSPPSAAGSLDTVKAAGLGLTAAMALGVAVLL
ncbi:hypothetical protein OIO90_002238 [Microbotryomycetes sp. JL221]|nr:hypothetical protein OIO90_002238 [Microbotryomycetes sp. JL221]